MKSTGITRKIDDLGRIVIPKETRKTLRIEEGSPIEIFTEGASIILRRYSPVKEFGTLAPSLAEGMGRNIGAEVFICDESEWHNGAAKGELLSQEVERWIRVGTRQKGMECSLVNGGERMEAVLFIPVMFEKKPAGGVVAVGKKEYSESDLAVLQAGADVITSYITQK